MKKAILWVLLGLVVLTLLGATCEGSGGDGANQPWTPAKSSQPNITSLEANSLMNAIQCNGCACELNGNPVPFPAGECIPENANRRDK